MSCDAGAAPFCPVKTVHCSASFLLLLLYPCTPAPPTHPTVSSTGLGPEAVQAVIHHYPTPLSLCARYRQVWPWQGARGLCGRSGFVAGAPGCVAGVASSARLGASAALLLGTSEGRGLRAASLPHARPVALLTCSAAATAAGDRRGAVTEARRCGGRQRPSGGAEEGGRQPGHGGGEGSQRVPPALRQLLEPGSGIVCSFCSSFGWQNQNELTVSCEWHLRRVIRC